MSLLSTIILLSGVLSVAFSQRFLYGREQPYGSGQGSGQPYLVYRPQQYRPSKAVAIISGKVKGVITFEQIVCLIGCYIL